MKKTASMVLFASLMLLATTGCKKELDKLNKNPNNPERAEIQLVLPNAQAYTGYIMGNYNQLWGGLWSQYWTQSPDAVQYREWDKYLQSGSDMDRPWTQMYSGVLTDLDYIEQTAIKAEKKNWAAIAKIMKAYSFQYLTDCFGDVPFSEALKGSGNYQPLYDDQQSVYTGIEQLLTDAVYMIDASSSDRPGTEDLYFGGNMNHWKEFANTLRLRVYLRQSETTEAARCKDSVAVMIARGDDFLKMDIKVSFSGAINQRNPLNAALNSSNPGNLIASSTIIDSMKSYKDPRLGIFFNKPMEGNPSRQNDWFGFEQGLCGDPSYVLPNNTSFLNWSTPSAAVGGAAIEGEGGNAPVYIMSAAESSFLLAEAYARNWAAGSDGQTEYEGAITFSFNQWGLNSTDLSLYLSDSRVTYPVSIQARLRSIGTQKWFAFCGSQNLESWIEWRRTGFPDFFKPSVSSVLPANVFPVRFIYPNEELTKNPHAAEKYQTVDKRVWWDVN